MNRFLGAAGAVTLVAASLLSTSCTGAAPVATRAEPRLVYIDDLEIDEVYEALAVEVHVEDADGLDDIESLHVAHDESALYWSFEGGEWGQLRREGVERFVIGTLAVPDGTRMPRGRYRVIAVDRAGHSDETTFTLGETTAVPAREAFPRLEMQEEQGERVLRVDGSFERVLVQGYTGDGAAVGEITLSPGETRHAERVSWLQGPARDLRLYVQATDPDTGAQLRRGPYLP
ncbi:MAG: hypothetical protein ACLFRR_05505 [Spirochaetaceae bacterium]